MSLIGFDKKVEKILINATSPFGFSGVRERSILRILKLIACDNGQDWYLRQVGGRSQRIRPLKWQHFLQHSGGLRHQDHRGSPRRSRDSGLFETRH